MQQSPRYCLPRTIDFGNVDIRTRLVRPNTADWNFQQYTVGGMIKRFYFLRAQRYEKVDSRSRIESIWIPRVDPTRFRGLERVSDVWSVTISPNINYISDCNQKKKKTFVFVYFPVSRPSTPRFVHTRHDRLCASIVHYFVYRSGVVPFEKQPKTSSHHFDGSYEAKDQQVFIYIYIYVFPFRNTYDSSAGETTNYLTVFANEPCECFIN